MISQSFSYAGFDFGRIWSLCDEKADDPDPESGFFPTC